MPPRSFRTSWLCRSAALGLTVFAITVAPSLAATAPATTLACKLAPQEAAAFTQMGEGNLAAVAMNVSLNTQANTASVWANGAKTHPVYPAKITNALATWTTGANNGSMTSSLNRTSNVLSTVNPSGTHMSWICTNPQTSP